MCIEMKVFTCEHSIHCLCGEVKIIFDLELMSS